MSTVRAPQTFGFTLLLFIVLCVAIVAARRANASTTPAPVPSAQQTLAPVPPFPKPQTSGYAPVNGVRLWYGLYGRGKPVILIHGALGSSIDWSGQISVLAAHYRVIVLDNRGHGRSTQNTTYASFHDMASDVIGLMDDLHMHRAAIVGWSDGAIIGLDMAMSYPNRVTKLFAFGANSDPAATQDTASKAFIAALLSRFASEYRELSPTPNGFSKLLRADLKRDDTEPHFRAAQLRLIRVPTWIADGDHDQFIKRADTDYMASTIPHAGELILPRATHAAPIEDPALFNFALLHFLASP